MRPDAFVLTGRVFRSDLPRPLLDAFIDAGYLSCDEEGCLWLDPMAERIAWGAPDKSWETEEESQGATLADLWAGLADNPRVDQGKCD